MKLYFIFAMLFVLVLSGCSSQTASKEDLTELLVEFKKAQYNTEEYKENPASLYEEWRKLTTEEFLNKQKDKSIAKYTVSLSNNVGMPFEFQSLEITEKEQKDNEYMVYYAMEVGLVDVISQNIFNVVLKTGQASFVQVDGEWKIKSDYDQMINPEKFQQK